MDTSLPASCAASFETHIWPSWRDAYTKMRWPHLFPEVAEDATTLGAKVHRSQAHVLVTPDGRARVDALHYGIIEATSTEIITPSEHLEFSTRLERAEVEFTRQSRPRNQWNRDFNAYFGYPYPDEALALLNPLLLLRDYVCELGSNRMTRTLGSSTFSYRLMHNPDLPIDATDDPERLGSMAVDVTFTTSDPLMLLEWSALHAGEPFSTTRVTWLRQGVELDPAIFTDPRVPAPSLPFE